MVEWFWLILLIHPDNGYENCGDINIYSFGNALNTDFLGQYTQQEQTTDKRHVFSLVTTFDKQYTLWWSHFRNAISRWSISTIVGDEGSVVAYKDSHALHPSEIARQRSSWRVYNQDTKKWVIDKSIHVKCNDVVSLFEWKQDCLVLGVSSHHNKFHKMDGFDYLKISGLGLNAKYYSSSSGCIIQHDGTCWNIVNKDGTTIASTKSTAKFPNGMHMTNNAINWKLNTGETCVIAIHCEVPEKRYYFKQLREKSEVCTRNSPTANFKNEHFETVVMKDIDEWSFGLTKDLKYFLWNETVIDGKSHKIPSVGIGTAGINNDREVIIWAVNKYGYELIDSASDHAPWYQNENIIGNLLQRNILKRNEFIVTTKLYAKDQGLYGAKHGLDDSLSGLNMDYIDIYLIHHPYCDNKLCDGSWKTSWRVIEDYYFENKIKYVGISNFDINQFHELLDWTNIPISIVQNWFDPFHQNDRNMFEESKKLSIIYQAYSLLGTQWKYISNGYHGNKDPVFTNNKLKQIANRYSDKSIAQIVLRWALQNKIAILPSSSKENRIKENIDIFDFELSEQDMTTIDQIS